MKVMEVFDRHHAAICEDQDGPDFVPILIIIIIIINAQAEPTGTAAGLMWPLAKYHFVVSQWNASFLPSYHLGSVYVGGYFLKMQNTFSLQMSTKYVIVMN